MAAGSLNYFDMAENDYIGLKILFTSGVCTNMACSVAQKTCERYLKHLIDLYCTSVDTTAILKAHSLQALRSFLSVHLPSFTCDWRKVIAANGMYYDNSYPGDNAFLVNEDDMDTAFIAVKEARRAVIQYTKTHDIPKSLDLSELKSVDSFNVTE